MKKQPGTSKTHKNRPGAIKPTWNLKNPTWHHVKLTQSRMVTDGYGGYKRLQGRSDDFSWQTHEHTPHHNIYITIIITMIIITTDFLIIDPLFALLHSRISSQGVRRHWNQKSKHCTHLIISVTLTLTGPKLAEGGKKMGARWKIPSVLRGKIALGVKLEINWKQWAEKARWNWGKKGGHRLFQFH